MSDLLSTVKILAGSTGEIAAASVGDQRPVATLRMAEDNNSVEILNGLEAVEVSTEVPEEAEVEEPMISKSDLKIEGELEELPSALQAEETTEVGDDHVKSEEAEVEEPMIGRSDVKIEEGEQEELPLALHAEEETTEVGDDHVKSEEAEVEEPMISRSDLKIEGELEELSSALQAEETTEVGDDHVKSEEAEVEELMIGRSDVETEGGEVEELPSVLQAVEETTEVRDDHVKCEEDSPVVAEMNAESPASSEEESLSPEVMLSEDETISGSAEVTTETATAVGHQIEEDKALCHEPAATETEHSDLTAPPTGLEEALQTTTDSGEEVAVEMILDSVEEVKPAVESGNVTMTMAQA